MISVMALLGRNYIRKNHSKQGQCCSGEIKPQVIFTTHLPTDIIKYLKEMLVQSVPTE